MSRSNDREARTKRPRREVTWRRLPTTITNKEMSGKGAMNSVEDR
jgi:hypothetical protein